LAKLIYILLFSLCLLITFQNISIAGLKSTASKFNVFADLSLNGTIFDATNLEQELFFIKQNADTVVGVNKITKVWSDGANINVALLISKSETAPIKLSLFNLLGKEVKVMYEGFRKEEDYIYSANINELPNGVYICVLTSNNYRDAKKFVISK